MHAEAEASLKTAQERQPNASSTWKLEAQMAAAQGSWSEAESRLLALGGRSAAELRNALAQWPQGLVPDQNVPGTIWQCIREHATSCQVKTEAPESAGVLTPETLFAEERWEQLAAMPASRDRTGFPLVLAGSGTGKDWRLCTVDPLPRTRA